MEYKIAHGYSLNKENNSLIYKISYLNKEGQPHIILTSNTYKGRNNTWTNSVQVTPDGYNELKKLVNNILIGQQRDEAYSYLMKVNEVSGNPSTTSTDNMYNLLKILQITPSEAWNLPGVADFLMAWQYNQGTILPLQELIKNGWLPKEALLAEEKRLSSIDWITIDFIKGRIREYSDTVEGIFAISSGDNELIQIKILQGIKNLFELQILIQVSPIIMERIRKNVFGGYVKWINENINKRKILSFPIKEDRSVPDVRTKVWSLLERFRDILVASEVKMDIAITEKFANIAKILFCYFSADRYLENGLYASKILRDNKIKAINLRFVKQEEKDIALKEAEYEHNRQIAFNELVKEKNAEAYRIDASGRLKEAINYFSTPIVYERFSTPFIEEPPKVEVIPVKEDIAIEVTPDVKVTPVKKDVEPIPIKKNTFWSQILTGVTVGAVSAWILRK